MKLKNLFTVPEGQKITEKCLYKVLSAYICSILLCMTCLAGSTWAWFTVSVENTGNEIYIGNPEIKLWMVDMADSENIAELTAPVSLDADNMYTFNLVHANVEDSLSKKSVLYVTVNFYIEDDLVDTRVISLDDTTAYKAVLEIKTTLTCYMGWSVSWFPPNDMEPLKGDKIQITVGEKPDQENTEQNVTADDGEGADQIESEEESESQTGSVEESTEKEESEEESEGQSESTEESTEQKESEEESEGQTESAEESTEQTESAEESTEQTESAEEDNSTDNVNVES